MAHNAGAGGGGGGGANHPGEEAPLPDRWGFNLNAHTPSKRAKTHTQNGMCEAEAIDVLAKDNAAPKQAHKGIYSTSIALWWGARLVTRNAALVNGLGTIGIKARALPEWLEHSRRQCLLSAAVSTDLFEFPVEATGSERMGIVGRVWNSQSKDQVAAEI
jgi:hypothetical protein